MDSHILEGIDPEVWNEVKSCFTERKWGKINEYSKRRNCRLLENYKLFVSLGFKNVEKPFYMCKRKYPVRDSSSDSDEIDDAKGIKNKNSTFTKRGKPKTNKTSVRPKKISNTDQKICHAQEPTASVSFKVDDKDSKAKRSKVSKSNTLLKPEEGSNTHNMTSKAQGPIFNNSSEWLSEHRQHLTIPKHLENVRGPLNKIDLDGYQSDNENDGGFRGFANEEIESSVIRFNYYQYVKKTTENNKIIKENVSQCDKIQESSVEYNTKSNTAKDGPKDSRYPRRSIPLITYTEDPVLDNDEYIYCDICETEWEADCPNHGPLTLIPDSIVDPKANKGDQKAKNSVPHGLKVAQSALPDEHAGLGVWTLVTIPNRSVFGPYNGRKENKNNKSGYCWQISKNHQPLYCVDALHPHYGNWMRYVNCARRQDEQNVVAFQFKRQIYYRTFAEIPPHTELLVFYGNHYAKQLGINLENFRKKINEPLKSVGFRCVHCSTVFSSPMYKERHEKYCKKNMHKDDLSRKHVCDECGKRFTHSCRLNKHKLIHSGIKPFTCTLCDQKFTQKNSYDKHVRVIHNKEKNYICDVCNKRFSQSCGLVKHKRSHDRERPYRCDTCHKKFTQQNSLISHIRTHTGERPYVCDVCGKGFTRSNVLTIHMRVHSGEKPYNCTYCHMKFTTNGNKNKHMKTKHKV